MPVPVVEALETVYRRETSYKHLSAFGQCRNAEDQARIVGLSHESTHTDHGIIQSSELSWKSKMGAQVVE